MALDKEKVMDATGKVVEKLNEVGEKTSQKATQFAQDKGLDKKAETAKEKTTGFIKDHKLDVAAEKTAGVIGTGMRKVGEGLHKAGSSIEKKMNERQEARKLAEEEVFEEEPSEGTDE